MHVLAVFGLAHGRETEDERQNSEEGSEREARHDGCLCFGPGNLQCSLSFFFNALEHTNHSWQQLNM